MVISQPLNAKKQAVRSSVSIEIYFLCIGILYCKRLFASLHFTFLRRMRFHGSYSDCLSLAPPLEVETFSEPAENRVLCRPVFLDDYAAPCKVNNNEEIS